MFIKNLNNILQHKYYQDQQNVSISYNNENTKT